MKKPFLFFLSLLFIHCSPINIQIETSLFIQSEKPQDILCVHLNSLFEQDIGDALRGDLNPYSVKQSMERTLTEVLPKKVHSKIIRNYSEKWLLFLKKFQKYKKFKENQTPSSEKDLKQSFLELLSVSKKLNLSCIYEESYDHFIKTGEWDIPFFDSLKPVNHKLVYGAKKVMSTVYQSCDVTSARPISIEDTLNLKGVSITKKHQQGGWNRKIINKKKLLETHYYLKYSNQLCHNVKVSPLLYDFGGKPSFYKKPFPTLDFFTNQGSGSHYLGIDCSGFVFSALASAGLRLHPNQPIKVSDVLNVGSANFKTPAEFKCLEKISPSHDMPFQEGDIVASKNHIFIVDTIFKNDPFHLKPVTKAQDCHSLNIKDFNFIIIQSSPNLGINRMHSRELDSNNYYSAISTGLKKLATSLCLKKFNKKHKPFSEISVIRHKQTEECTEKEVYLKNQECLKHCSL